MPRSDTPSSLNSFIKDALWYTAAAGGALGLIPVEADAQIIHTDVDPDETVMDGDFAIDFDDDGDPELILLESDTGIGTFANFENTTGPDDLTGIVGNTNSGYTYFLPLNAGSAVSAGNVIAPALLYFSFTFGGSDPNGWLGADAFAGIEFTLDTGTHYGWIRIEIPVGGGSMTIKEFAYESTPDTPINAGDMPVAIEPGPDGLPGTHNLSSIYPNPFNPQAQFSLEIAEQQNVNIAVFDALGRQVALLHDGVLGAGSVHQFQIDGANLPSGVYVVRTIGEQFTDVRQVTLTK